MLGAIIGDVCGSVYEFNNCKSEMDIELFAEGCFPTDDSVMTVAVARALMDSKGMRDGDVKECLINSMHYFGNLFPKAGYGEAFGEWLCRYDFYPYNSWGNGAGMRVTPVGWLYDTLEETLHYAKLAAEVTHNHPEAIKGAQAISACVFLARTGASKEEIREYTKMNFYSLDFTLDEIRPDYEFDVSCQGSCPQAIEAFLEGSNYEDVIIKAISLGGDSDTIACMAGGIAEAFYGLPKELKDRCYETAFADKKDRRYVYNNSILRREVDNFYKYVVEGAILKNVFEHAPAGEFVMHFDSRKETERRKENNRIENELNKDKLQRTIVKEIRKKETWDF